MSKLALDKGDYAALTEARRNTRSKKEYTRLTAILDLADGMKPGVVCAALRVDEATLWRWRSRYEDKGVAGLADDHYDSRNSRLTAAQEADLDGLLGDKVTRDAKTVAAIIKNRYGVEYTPAGATALMKRLGYSWHEPHPEPAKADVVAQAEALVKMEALRAAVGDDRFYSLDAVHPRNGAESMCGWIKKGRRHPLPATASREGVNIHGALSASGELIWREDDKVTEASTIAILQAILGQHPGGEPVGAVCDGGPYYHRSLAVRAFLKANPRLTLIQLPRASPNLNKIERLWGLMRRSVLKNVYLETLGDFRKAVHGFLNGVPTKYENEVKALLAAPCHIANFAN